MRDSEALEQALLRALAARPLCWHLVCERDVGLFSLVQQVIAQVPWALSHCRVPVVAFGPRTIYWQPERGGGPTSAWEEFFDPVVGDHPVASVPGWAIDALHRTPPDASQAEMELGDGSYASSHFGDHPLMSRLAPRIPFETADPDARLRRWTAAVVRRFVMARIELAREADSFWQQQLDGRQAIGVHVRGTDATSAAEQRAYRQGSLDLDRYQIAIEHLLGDRPDARVFVATDAASSLDFLVDRFGDRVVALDSLRHHSGDPAGHGPTGWIMPAYMAGSREAALRNGREAVMEWLLLRRCVHLVHNGAGMAVTALLAEPDLADTNTHRRAES